MRDRVMKYVAAGFIGDQVEIPLAVFLFLISQAMKFFRQWAQRFGEQPKVGHTNGELAGPGSEQRALSAENIAEVIMLESRLCLRTGNINCNVKLDTAAHILDRREARLAHDAFQYHASRHAHSPWRLFQHFVGMISIFADEDPDARSSRRKSLGKALPA